MWQVCGISSDLGEGSIDEEWERVQCAGRCRHHSDPVGQSRGSEGAVYYGRFRFPVIPTITSSTTPQKAPRSSLLNSAAASSGCL